MKLNFIFSILIALIFLLTGIISENNDYVFAINMTFLPTVLFPILCVNLKKLSWSKILIYLIISYAILLILLASYFLNDKTYHSILFGSFLSSLFFQTAIKRIFDSETSWKTIFIISLFCSLTFIPFHIFREYYYLGFGMFSWIILNGFLASRNT